MPTHRAGKELRLGRKTAKVVLDLLRRLRVPDLPLADHHPEAAQTNPFRMPFRETFGQRNHMLFPPLLAAMVFLIGATGPMFHSSEVIVQGDDKRFPHVRMDRLLVPL